MENLLITGMVYLNSKSSKIVKTGVDERGWEMWKCEVNKYHPARLGIKVLAFAWRIFYL